MKPMKKRLLSLLLTLVTILSLLPTSAFAASKTGSGIQITQDQAYWSTRLLANGTPYSYRPPLADGKLVYCMDSGLGYHYATKSFLDSYSWTSGSGADADAVLQSALTNSGLSEMDAMTVENVKWMMTYLNDCKDSNVGQLFMAVQTYVWENQSYKGEPSGDGDAGGYANADTYELYLSLIDNLLAKKAAEDAEFLKQIEAYKAQGIEASIVEDESAKWAVFAISSNRKNQSFFNYYGPRKLSVGEAKPDQPEQPVGGTGKITLTKTAAGTLKGLPGARYSIYFNGQIVGSDVTNESGELHIENAATGLWTFIETDAPSGFCVDPTPKSVYVDASEGDREYTVAAVNYATVTADDIDLTHEILRIPDARFCGGHLWNRIRHFRTTAHRPRHGQNSLAAFARVIPNCLAFDVRGIEVPAGFFGIGVKDVVVDDAVCVRRAASSNACVAGKRQRWIDRVYVGTVCPFGDNF